MTASIGDEKRWTHESLADDIPVGIIRWDNVEIYFGTTSQPNFNYISTLFQRQMPAGMTVRLLTTDPDSSTFSAA